jgi:ribonuclease HII
MSDKTSLFVGPDFSLETAAGAPARRIAGVDEAGRGAWAGPLVAAAVVLDVEHIPDGLDDSKKLSAKKRDLLFDEILAHADVGIGIGTVEQIEVRNVLNATMDAMRDAVSQLTLAPDVALIDGNKVPLLQCDAEAIVGGDGRSVSIAAASIIAKVTRDRLMRKLAHDFPDYGWEKNVGYGVPVHKAALARLGVTPHHRRSYKPIRNILGTDTST